MKQSTTYEMQSLDWLFHFRNNSNKNDQLDWTCTYQLSSDEKALISPSIQQFELGENSEGKTFIKNAQKYADKNNDPLYVEALKVFIKEEQGHSATLRRFMELQGIPCVRKHWVDSTFRRLRKMIGLEISITVLVSAEVIAMTYYQALKRATESPLLKHICRNILSDETSHLQFQGSMLGKARRNNSLLLRTLGEISHVILMAGTLCVVWLQHRKFYTSSGYSFLSFTRQTIKHFKTVVKYSRRAYPVFQSEETAVGGEVQV